MHWHFAHASYLHLLWVAIPLTVVFLTFIHRTRQKARTDWAEKHIGNKYQRPLSIGLSVLNAAGWLGIVLFTVMAMAWPMAPDKPDQISAGSTQIVCTFDVSWSMQGEDYRGMMPGSEPGSTVATGASGSRLQMARHLCEQVMHATAGNDMGLVTYMGKGFTIFPVLTSDYAGLKTIMDFSLKPGNADGEGSYVANGLSEAISLFQREGDPKKQHVIVLFSDGGNDSSQEDLSKVISALKDKNIRLVVVGLGGDKQIDLPIYDDQTGAFIKWRPLDTSGCSGAAPAGNDGGGAQDKHCDSTAIDEGFLTKLAEDASGQYYAVPPGSSSLHIQWAAALHGDTTEPTGKPMFLWCLAGVALCFVMISIPGVSRRRVVL